MQLYMHGNVLETLIACASIMADLDQLQSSAVLYQVPFLAHDETLSHKLLLAVGVNSLDLFSLYVYMVAIYPTTN